MDFLSIAKTVGAGAISALVPGGPAIVAGINALLPDEYKMPENVTGKQAEQTIQSLDPETKAKVLSKQFDVKIEQIQQSYDTLRTMLTQDATNPQSTRPKIAWLFAWVLALNISFVSAVWGYSVLTESKDMTQAIMSGWPFLLSVVGPIVTMLMAYFGILRKENREKLNAANGFESEGAMGKLIKGLMK